MTLSDKEIIELNDLCDRLVENNLSFDKRKRLESWLTQSAEARKFYVSYMDMSVSLGYFADESLAVVDNEEELSLKGKIVMFCQTWLPYAALLIFGCYLYFSLPLDIFQSNEESAIFENDFENEKESSLNYQGLPKPTVAVLTKSVDLIWDNKPNNFSANNSAFSLGFFSFSSGMAQLEFMQGTTTILEGPVETELIHENAMAINFGKMRAHVPKVAVGFTVDLPMGRVIDLGTDFGVDVHREGSAEVFVYRGKVIYEGVDFEGNQVSKQLSAGEAIHLDPYGVMTPLDMPTGNFIGSADLAYRSLENANRRRNAWLEKSRELASATSTLLYYGFDNHDPWARILKDETRRDRGAGDGAVIGCNWTEGRWPGKGALQFAQDNDRVCLNINQPLKSATLAAWVRLDVLEEHGAPLVFSRPSITGALGWAINANGKLVLEIKTPQSFEKYESAVAFSPDRLGKWVHLASTFDGKTKWVNHFINGRSFSREKVNQSKLITLRKGLLGHFQAFPNRNPDRSLKGSIDEFAIFDSAWEEGDIRELYEVGSPRKQPF